MQMLFNQSALNFRLIATSGLREKDGVSKLGVKLYVNA